MIFYLDCLTLEDGRDSLSRNVGKNCNSTLSKIPEDRRSQIQKKNPQKLIVFTNN